MSKYSLTTKYTPLTEDQREKDETTIFGFWVYLMTDFILFASLFSVYAVMRANTFGGFSGVMIFDLPYVLIETILLLTSSFTMGLALIAARYERRGTLIWGLVLTGILGAAFLGMELTEFAHLFREGASWKMSGFLSSYFALVGTHGLHIFIGLVWIVGMVVVLYKKGITRFNLRKLVLLSLFWHFLDLVWIFIFTVVYLLGII